MTDSLVFPVPAEASVLANLVLAWSLIAGGPSTSASPAGRGVVGRGPRVLVVVWDDVGWDALSDCYTPTWDREAERSVVLRRFYAQPTCSPARVCLFTGDWAFRHGLGKPILGPQGGASEFAPPPPAESLFGAFGGPAALIGKWHLTVDDPRSAIDGWGASAWQAGTYGNIPVRALGERFDDWTRLDQGVVTRETTYATEALTDAAIAQWQAVAGELLLVVTYHDAHGPPHEPPEHLVRFPSDHLSTPVRLFRDSVSALDAETGRLLDAAEDADLVILLADNGTDPNVSPSIPTRRGKATVFETGTRVPALIRYPGVRPRESFELASVVDLAPTILEFAGRPSVGRDGVSLLPLLQSGRPVRDHAYVQFFRPNGFGSRDKELEAIVHRRWKLVRSDGVEELYDLLKDPDELAPIAPEDGPGIHRHLAALLDALGE